MQEKLAKRIKTFAALDNHFAALGTMCVHYHTSYHTKCKKMHTVMYLMVLGNEKNQNYQP